MKSRRDLRMLSSQAEDLSLLRLARSGKQEAFSAIISKYLPSVRLRAKSFFMMGGDQEDLVQEGLIGLTKAINDYRGDHGSSFRSFAGLCVSRQIITAIKSASRLKHSPLNHSLSLSQPLPGESPGSGCMADILPGSADCEPFARMAILEQVEGLKNYLVDGLSEFEASVLSLDLEDRPYSEIAMKLGCDTKSVDNALQRIKKKVNSHARNYR